MRDELHILRELRPSAKEPPRALAIHAREVLLAKIAAEAPDRRRLARRFGGRSLRRWVVPCLAVVGLGAAGVGLAGGLRDWWTSADPPVRADEVTDVLDFGPPPPTESGRSEPDASRARTVARAPGAALVVAPTSQGGYCLVPVPDDGEASFVCFGGEADSERVSWFLSWVYTGGEEPAWYLLGRIEGEGARVELFERVTHPFERDGSDSLPGTPISVDAGAGGFFLARVPRELWPQLDLGYGAVTVLDGEGAVLTRGCRFLGSSPESSLAPRGISSAGDPLASDPARVPAAHPCPATGSAAEAVTMVPARARSGDFAGIAARNVTTAEHIELSTFIGRPLLLAVWNPDSALTARYLNELETFVQRHPDAQVLGVSLRGRSARKAGRLVRELGLTFPTIAVTGRDSVPLLDQDAHGNAVPHVLAVDSTGAVALELAVPASSRLWFRAGLVTQDALDEALASAADR